MAAGHGAICKPQDDDDDDDDDDNQNPDLKAAYDGMYSAMCKVGGKAGFSAEKSAELAKQVMSDFKKSRKAFFTSSPEMSKIQRIHNIASEGGTHCCTQPSNQSGPTYKDNRSDGGINDLSRLNATGGRDASAASQPAVTGNPMSGPTYPQSRDDGGISDNTKLNQMGSQTGGVSTTPVPLTQTMAAQLAIGTTPDTSGIVQGKDGQGAPPLYEDHSKDQTQFSAAAVATPSPVTATTTISQVPNGTPVQQTMSPAQQQLANMNGGRLPVQAVVQTPITTPAQPAGDSPALIAERTRRIEAEAKEFAQSELTSGRAMVAEFGALVDDYKRAANDDVVMANMPVVFDGHTMTRVEALRQTHMKRLAHTLNKEQLAVQQAAVATFASGSPGASANGHAAQTPMNDTRRKQLLSLTQLGRSSQVPVGAK